MGNSNKQYLKLEEVNLIMKRYKVIKEHNQLKNRFPLGYEGKFYNKYTEEDKTIPGFATRIHDEVHWVDESFIPKGTFKDVIFIDENGGEVSSAMIYAWTGRSVADFFQNLD